MWSGVILPQHIPEHANHAKYDDASYDSKYFWRYIHDRNVYFQLREICKAIKYDWIRR